MEDLTKFGGRKHVPMGADPNDHAAVHWNFGLKPKPMRVTDIIAAKPSFHERFPKLAGKWDGKTTINHAQTALKALGGDTGKLEQLIQMQPRGTCGGRSGSAAGDLIQLVLIASGKRAKFHRVSHAAVYYAARKISGMLSGDWRDENNDGVGSGSVPEALSKITGYVQREEDGDLNYYGDGSDDLACKLGSGMLPDVAKKIEQLGEDNKIEWGPIRSAQEGADAIASGCILIGSDSQGFTMTRDQNGFCQPQGRWDHYQTRVSVLGPDLYGRPGFGYWQSWGRNAPAGTVLRDHPPNCFGVDFNVQDRIIKSGDWAYLTGFPLWDLENDKVDVNWFLG